MGNSEDLFTFDEAIEYLNRNGCSIRPKGNGMNRKIICPKCRKDAMYYHVINNKAKCFKCDASFNAYSYAAEMLGVSTKEAIALIMDGKQAGYVKDISHDDIYEPVPSAPIEITSAVNAEMLRMMPLSKKHIEDMMKRGLTYEEVMHLCYGSYVNDEEGNARKLMAKGYSLEGIPPFYYDQDTRCWKSKWSYEGIMVPYLNCRKNIQYFQIRKDKKDVKLKKNGKEDQKYSCLSSNGKYRGAKVNSGVHFACDWVYNLSAHTYEPEFDGRPWAITEGAMKGDIAHIASGYGPEKNFRGGMNFLCIPGTKNQAPLRSILKYMKKHGVTTFYDCFDMDYLTNENVQQDMVKLHALFYSEGCELKRFNWQTQPEPGVDLKGIDDYIIYWRSKGKLQLYNK